MLCLYCEDTELIQSLYWICTKCKIAMTQLELGIAIRSNEDADRVSRLLGKDVIKATKQD